jgi:histidinol-phosphate aminotransferase
MTQLTEGFKALGLDWIPSAGNFVAASRWAMPPGYFQTLLRQGVIVRPVANYGHAWLSARQRSVCRSRTPVS